MPTVTSPSRGFTARGLQALPKEQRYQLAYAAVTEMGFLIKEVDLRHRHADFIVETRPLFTSRLARIRLLYYPPTQEDVCTLAALAKVDELADYLLIETTEGQGAEPSDATRRISATRFIEILEQSAWITWSGGIPDVSRGDMQVLREYARNLRTEDAIGLCWLPTLAQNKLPWELRTSNRSADDWLERVFFRLATGPLGLKGTRLGSADRGTRLPDGLLITGEGHGFIYDCKASRDGYVMPADHERRFLEYANNRYSHRGKDISIHSIAIVSSSFPGKQSREHPFYARERAIRAGCGIQLAYVRAIDLSYLARLLIGEQSTSLAESIDWAEVFSSGLVGIEDLRRAVGSL